MVVQCILPTCKQQIEGGKGGGYSGFFNLPQKKEIRQKWIDATGLDQKYLDKTGDYRVCYRHFNPSDFKTDLKYLRLHYGKDTNKNRYCHVM